MIKVFIDGAEGTTGLKIRDRLKEREDVLLLEIPSSDRKETAAREEYINSSDVTFLCLPDDAARDAAGLVKNDKVKIIDASTAHRVSEGWVYGLPELEKSNREAIKKGKRVAVPGCHASGFISLVYPLIKAGVVSKDYPFTCLSLTGYSGGGKKMIAEYQSENRAKELSSPRQYAIGQNHKHLKEMTKYSGISSPPVFSPIVADFYSGMEVSVPLNIAGLSEKVVHETLKNHYEGSKVIEVLPLGGEEFSGFIAANLLSGKDCMKIIVSGTDGRVLLTALYDNLGKGASGAAIQCFNIMNDIEETRGLVINGIHSRRSDRPQRI